MDTDERTGVIQAAIMYMKEAVDAEGTFSGVASEWETFEVNINTNRPTLTRWSPHSRLTTHGIPHDIASRVTRPNVSICHAYKQTITSVRYGWVEGSTMKPARRRAKV